MWNYIFRRLFFLSIALFGGAILIFVVMRAIPGDIALIMVLGGEEQEFTEGTQRKMDKIREDLGLNRPKAVQFGDFVWSFVTGDWGESAWTNQPVRDIVSRGYQVTLQLSLMALVISLLVALPVGILSAVKQDTRLDYVLRTASIVSLSIPNFWLALIAIFILGAYLKPLFPPLVYQNIWQDPIANMKSLLIPSLILGTAYGGLTARMVRSSMLEVIREDYMRTAYAKGLPDGLAIRRHALKNALIPVVTLAGVQLGNLLNGSIVVELVFNLPGLGLNFIEAVRSRDFPVVQVLVLIFTVAYGLLNLSVDVFYAWLNPRIRYQ